MSSCQATHAPIHRNANPRRQCTFSDPRPYHVLVTGFGPFSHYAVNPSWLAVKPLHNTVLKADITIEPVSSNGQSPTVDPDGSLVTREIHITALQVSVTYEAILSILPGLHSQPPVLPSVSDLPLPPPPPDGYDLFFHVGVMGSPSLQLERLGHKFGYDERDAAGALAPIVCMSQEEASRQHYGIQHMEMANPRDDDFQSAVGANETPSRGFGKGYESFAEELYTDIDVDGLVQHLKKCGIEKLTTSMDAGRYLCDFIYYCSLAESRRSSAKDGGKSIPRSQVIFLHCPPADSPLTTEEVTDAIKQSVVWLCSTSRTV